MYLTHSAGMEGWRRRSELRTTQDLFVMLELDFQRSSESDHVKCAAADQVNEIVDRDMKTSYGILPKYEYCNTGTHHSLPSLSKKNQGLCSTSTHYSTPFCQTQQVEMQQPRHFPNTSNSLRSCLITVYTVTFQSQDFEPSLLVLCRV